jgi:phage gp29-like protein
VAVQLNIDVPLEWAREQLGIPAPQGGEAVIGGGVAEPNPVQGTAVLAAQIGLTATPFPDQVAVDALVDALPDERLQQQAEQLLAPLLEALHQGGDEAQLLEHLSKALPGLHNDELQEALERMFFALDVWARLHAEHERGIA